MQLLSKSEIMDRINSAEADRISIDPLLEFSQVGDITLDLRLGYDFLVSILTRKPYISIDASEPQYRGVGSYFQFTRRELGDRFILYPSQIVLATTLEYVSLPPDVCMDVLSRSSYTRLGIHVNSMVQPGYRGCVPLELFNHGNNALELIVGSRVCQVRFIDTENSAQYQNGEVARKYYGNVRPTPSRASLDPDLVRLNAVRNAPVNSTTP